MRAENDELAEYLINNYDVDLLVTDTMDYKSVLHIAIENGSPIRFLVTERAPDLLLFLDQARRSPFFVACMKGDYRYIEWLFQKLMQDPGVESPVERGAVMGDIQLVSPVIKTPPARLAEVGKAMSVSMTDINDDSVFHILAQEGNCKLLELVYCKRRFIEGFTPKVFLQCCNQAKGDCTPLQIAIQENRVTCLEVMLKYIVNLLVESGDKDLLEQVADLRLLREVVGYGHIEMMKVLVRSGLWYEELNDTSLYSQCNRQSQEMLFLLMSVYAAVDNIKSLTSNSSESQIGCIQWSGLFVCSLHPLLLTVASTVIDQTKRCLEHWRTTNAGSSKETTSPLNDRLFLQTIGEECLKIVEEQFVVESLGSPSNQLPSVPRSWEIEEFASLRHITQLNLASNELREVPIELFLLPHLESLDLSNNQLGSLPSATQPPSPELGVGIHEQGRKGMGQRVSYRCNNLRCLQLSNNCLQSLPSQLFTLEMLEELDASHNSLSVLPLLLWLPSKLNKLILHHNRLSQLHSLSTELKDNPQYVITVANTHWHSKENIRKSIDQSLPAMTKEIDNFCDFLSEQLQLGDVHVPDATTPVDEGEPQSVAGQKIVRSRSFHDWIRKSKKRSHNFISENIDGLKDMSETRCQQTAGMREFMEEEALPINALETLDLSHNRFTTVPWDLPCLAPSLTDINLSHNAISSTDLVHDFPESLEMIEMMNCQLKSVTGLRRKSKFDQLKNIEKCGQFIIQILGSLFKKNWRRDNCVHCNQSALPHLNYLDLSQNEITFLPLSTSDVESKDALSLRVGKEVVFFPNLGVLLLSGNGQMRTLSKSIHMLSLIRLDISNTGLEKLPHELGLCNGLNLVTDGVSHLEDTCQQFVDQSDNRKLLQHLKSSYR